MEERKKRLWMLVLAAALVLAALAAAFDWKAPHAARKTGGYIGVVRIDGEIYGGAGGGSLLSQAQGAPSEAVMQCLREAREDDAARAVVIRINSPGGSASAAQEIAEEVDKLREEKPVIISMGDLCASAGYWIASRGDQIFASPGTMTGSIGVYIDYNNIEGLMDILGVRNDKIKSGAHKDILSMSRPMTDEERAMLQAMVDDIYAQFVAAVAEGREMEEADVRALADGRIFTGRQAIAAGLVDKEGNYYDALDYAAEEAGIPKDAVHVYGASRGLEGLFSSEADAAGRAFAESVLRRMGAAAAAPAVK